MPEEFFDSALETTVNCTSDAGRLPIIQGLLFSRNKWLSEDGQRGGPLVIQFTGTGLGNRLLQRRMGMGGARERSRILSVTQIQQAVTLEAVARGHDLKCWGTDLGASVSVSGFT